MFESDNIKKITKILKFFFYCGVTKHHNSNYKFLKSLTEGTIKIDNISFRNY